jgi:hypothetical protein
MQPNLLGREGISRAKPDTPSSLDKNLGQRQWVKRKAMLDFCYKL